MQVIWNPTYSLGRAGGSPNAPLVGHSEVNGTKRTSVSYYISAWISYKVPVPSLQTAKSREQLLDLPTHEAYDKSITSPKLC